MGNSMMPFIMFMGNFCKRKAVIKAYVARMFFNFTQYFSGLYQFSVYRPTCLSNFHAPCFSDNMTPEIKKQL